MRRLAAVALALALAALVLPATAAAEEVVHVGPGGAQVREDPFLPPDDARPAPTGTCAPVRRRSAADAVETALRAAQRAGALTPEQAAAHRALLVAARATAQRLTGLRRRELAGAVSTVEDLAARGLLTPSRMPAAFLTLQRNTEFWPTRPIPRPKQPARRPCAGGAGLGGARVTFEGDPVVFQWYLGQGLQLQPLATFGRANALWAAGQAEELRATLERMLALGASRGGFLAWEYGFAFGGGRAPWISGLAQGTGVQAFTRGAGLLGEPRFLDAARRALGAFEAAPPVGVRVPAPGGAHYLIYSFAPRLRVLNGFLQALVGLFDHAQATGDPRAQRLFAAGDPAARRALPRFDTGAWSRYSEGGRESDLGYHRLLRDFLRSLCARTGATAYCARAQRFDGYLHEPARLAVAPPGAVAARRPIVVRLRLSKVACVTVRLVRAGRTARTLSAVLGGGRRTLALRAPGPGRFAVRVEARDLAGHSTRVTRRVSVAGGRTAP